MFRPRKSVRILILKNVLNILQYRKLYVKSAVEKSKNVYLKSSSNVSGSVDDHIIGKFKEIRVSNQLNPQ